MNPKEAAEDLIHKYWNIIQSNGRKQSAKSCAILHCQGIIDELEILEKYWRNDVINPVGFWQDVLIEINSHE